MIAFSFCFEQVFVPEILNAQVVCFLSIDLLVAIVMCVSINAGEMKTFENAKNAMQKSHLVKDLFLTKLKTNLIFVSYTKKFISSHIRSFEIPKKRF